MSANITPDKTDKLRQLMQLVLAGTLVSTMLGFIFWFIQTKASDNWLESLADTMVTLLIVGITAALIYFKLYQEGNKKVKPE